MSDAAIVSIVTGIVTIVSLWLKLRSEAKAVRDKVSQVRGDVDAVARKADSVEKKIDSNTEITVAGNTAATTNARVAATAAIDAKKSVDEVSAKLNGGIDSAIAAAVEPIKRGMSEHAATDDKNMRDINDKIAALDARIEEHNKYVHGRNHDILNKVAVLITKVDVLISANERDSPPRR